MGVAEHPHRDLLFATLGIDGRASTLTGTTQASLAQVYDALMQSKGESS